MSLPTNYKDDMFEGSRKYRMTDNGDGTYSFTDETNYLQHGSYYGAAEVNTINGAINDINAFIGKKLPAQTLSAGNTSMTFTDASITTTSTIEPYTDKWLVSPTAISVSNGSCTLTFKSQSSALSVFLIVR